MKKHTDTIQTMRLKDLGFPPPKGVSKLSLDWDLDTVPTFDYSIGELIEMLPSYVEWKGNYYDLQIKTECSYSWTVSYEPTQNDKAKIFPIYDGGSCLIDILYNVLINLVALKDELTDTGGHDEYNQGEVLSEVFKLKEKGKI
jgi:hypothetical protein